MSSVAPDTRRSTSSENGIDAPHSPSRAANPEYVFAPVGLPSRQAVPSQQCFRGSISGFTNTSAERGPASEFIEERLSSVDSGLRESDRSCSWVEEPLDVRKKRVHETLKRCGGMFPRVGPEGCKDDYEKEIELDN